MLNLVQENPYSPAGVLSDSCFFEKGKSIVRTAILRDEDRKVFLEYLITEQDKKVSVKYLRNGRGYHEFLGDYSQDPETLEEICDEFKSKLIEIFNEALENTGKSCAQIFDDGSYFQARERYRIDQFVKALDDYLKMFLHLNEHRIEAKEINPRFYQNLKCPFEAGISITDWNIPPLSVLIGVLFRNRYYKGAISSPLPNVAEIGDAHRRLVTLRSRCLDIIKTSPSVTLYSLYHNQKPVAVKYNADFHVLEPNLFKKAVTPPSGKEMLEEMAAKITSELISKMIREEQIIPETRRQDLQKYCDKILLIEILNSGAYGNVQRMMNILKDLRHAEGEQVRELGSVVTHLQKEGMVVSIAPNPKIPTAVQFRHPLTQKMYQYLQGQIPFTEIGINNANARQALTIVKMFDIGIKMINCASLNKHAYPIDSDLLRARIAEFCSQIQSFEAFTTLLDSSDQSRSINALVPSRNALHGKIATNSLLMVTWASKFLECISGVGGNSGAGKSTFLQGKGFNVDYMKALLKKGTMMLNSQVHTEGAALFNTLLKFIIKETGLNYTLDLRLLDIKYIQESILDPARSRGVNAQLTYLVVPLMTSLLRILARPTFGKDPCQHTSIVVDGYKAFHCSFPAIIELIKNDSIISHSEVHYKKGPDYVCIAVKNADGFKVTNRELFDSCFYVPTEPEIGKIANTPITSELLQEARENHDLYTEQAQELQKYIGLAIGDVVNKHANGEI